MIRVEISETVQRSIEEVFERLADIRRYPEWLPASALYITSIQDGPGPVGKGTLYTDRTRLGPMAGEVVEFEPPRRVQFRFTVRWLGIHVMQGWPGYRLEPLGGAGTRVHHVADGRLYGPFRLMEPAVRMLVRWERRRTVDALKRSLESDAP